MATGVVPHVSNWKLHNERAFLNISKYYLSHQYIAMQRFNHSIRTFTGTTQHTHGHTLKGHTTVGKPLFTSMIHVIVGPMCLPKAVMTTKLNVVFTFTY